MPGTRTPSIAALYAEGRTRICEVLKALRAEELDAPVPTCPGWNVADVVSHLVGSCTDIIEGRLDGVTSEAWTNTQVTARRGRPLQALLEEWEEVAPQVEAMSAGFPASSGKTWILDLTTHEHDIRGATRRAGARDSDGLRLTLEFLATRALSGSISSMGLEPLEVRTEQAVWRLGDGGRADQDAGDVNGVASDAGRPVLVAPSFELFRALTGRRSRRQIRGYDWTVDPEPYLSAFQFGPFRISDVDIVE